MSRTRQLPGGGRAVEVEPERLAGFLARFAAGHGGAVSTTVTGSRVEITAADGWTAVVPVPFAPLPFVPPAQPGRRDGIALAELVDHLMAPRRVGLVLVRLGGYSVGIAQDGKVLAASTGCRPVHGRSAAGGQSQQRFAHRRENQARIALRAAADAVARVLLPQAGQLDAVVTGGDAAALRLLAADRRLTGLLARAQPRVLDVAEPRRAVLDEVAPRVRCAEVHLIPPPDPPSR